MRHRECTGRNCVFYRLERWLCSRITGGPCTLMTAFKPFKAGGDSSCFPRTSTYASRHQRRRLQLDGRFTAAAFIKRGPIWRWQKTTKIWCLCITGGDDRFTAGLYISRVSCLLALCADLTSSSCFLQKTFQLARAQLPLIRQESARLPKQTILAPFVSCLKGCVHILII